MKRREILTIFVMFVHTVLYAQNYDKINIVRVDSIPTNKGCESHFTGNVRVNNKIPGGNPPNISGGIVNFEPGSRTVWHSHPKGQRVIIIQGIGWVQQWGDKKIEVRTGDVVCIPPNVKHWHGATVTTGVSHYAFIEIESNNEHLVENMEPVTDVQYKGK